MVKNGPKGGKERPGMVGGNIREAGLGEWLRSGKTFGSRIMLGTGLPAYEFNYLLHGPGGEVEILRLVLHTTRVDRILSDARRMWWIVGGVLVLLWVDNRTAAQMLGIGRVVGALQLRGLCP